MNPLKKIIIIAVAASTTISSAATYPITTFSPKRDSDELISEDPRPPRGNRFNAPNTKTDTAETASKCTEYSWYFRHTKNGIRPDAPSELTFIDKYNGYYLGEDEQVIYLTFDAGYENGNVEKILDILKEEQVCGAFFILEHLLVDNTDLVKRMSDEGHLVCNHTATHKNMAQVTTKDEFELELDRMSERYTELTGKDLAPFYRPPEGKFSESNLIWANEMGYTTVFWSFAYADWDNGAQISPEKAKDKILSETHNGEIILLHPTSATNAAILKELIREWKSMGYRFGSLDELREREN